MRSAAHRRNPPPPSQRPERERPRRRCRPAPPELPERCVRDPCAGSWKRAGRARPALVRLFSTILRKDPERHVLVTPVERVGIVVEDAPFLAVEMAVEGFGDARQIAFRTNVDDLVTVGADRPLRFERDANGGVRPYLRVRGDLWARVTRPLALDLVDLGEERQGEHGALFGLAAGGAFFAIAPAAELHGPA